MCDPTRKRLSNLYAPKALRAETRLGRLLMEMDPVEAKCDCKFKRTCRCPGCVRPENAPADWQPCDCCRDECLCGMLSCPHVIEARQGWPEGITIDEWALLLREYDRRGYSDPPPPQTPGRVLSRVARVALRAVRAAAGVSLWFPAPAADRRRRSGDLDPADVDQCSVQGAPNLRQAGLTLSVYDAQKARARQEEEEVASEPEWDVLAAVARAAAARQAPPAHPQNPLRANEGRAA